MSAAVGLEMYAYYNSNTVGSPTWVLIDQIHDLSKNRNLNAIAVGSRASPYEGNLPGLKKFELTFQLVRDDANAVQIALDTKYEAKTLTQFAIANGPIATTGTKYVKAEFLITKFDDGEPLEGVNMIDVELKLHQRRSADPAFTTV